MVMSAFLKSMFNFDLGLLIVFVHLRSGDAAWERSRGLTRGLFLKIYIPAKSLHVACIKLKTDKKCLDVTHF